MEWKNIYIDTHEFFYLYPKLIVQKSCKICQSYPVWPEGLNPSPCHFVTNPCVCYTTGWWESMDMRRHMLSFYYTEPSVLWPLHFFSKAEDIRRSHDFAYRNTETRKGIIWRKVGNSVRCPGCTLDGLPFCLCSYTQPLSTVHQPGTALHKRHSTASRPELTLLSAPLEHQRGDFTAIISSEFTWKMSHTIQGSAELWWSQKEHVLKKAPCSLNIWPLKGVYKYWNTNGFILAVVTNFHSDKISLLIYYISRSGHVS